MPANPAKPMPADSHRKWVTRIIRGDAFEIIKDPIRIAVVKAPELGTQKGQEVKSRRSGSKTVLVSKPHGQLKAGRGILVRGIDERRRKRLTEE